LAFVLASCGIDFSGGPPYGYNEETGKFPDTPENRKYFLYFIETDLQKEKNSKKSIQERIRSGWSKQFEHIKKSDENPQFYIDSFHKRRRELGLPPMPEIR